MPCADDWLFVESLLGLEDLEVEQLAAVEVGLGEVVDVGYGAGRVVEEDVDVDAGADVEAEGVAVAPAAARCAVRCGLARWDRPRPRPLGRWLDQADRVD